MDGDRIDSDLDISSLKSCDPLRIELDLLNQPLVVTTDRTDGRPEDHWKAFWIIARADVVEAGLIVEGLRDLFLIGDDVAAHAMSQGRHVEKLQKRLATLISASDLMLSRLEVKSIGLSLNRPAEFLELRGDCERETHVRP